MTDAVQQPLITTDELTWLRGLEQDAQKAARYLDYRHIALAQQAVGDIREAINARIIELLEVEHLGKIYCTRCHITHEEDACL